MENVCYRLNCSIGECENVKCKRGCIASIEHGVRSTQHQEKKDCRTREKPEKRRRKERNKIRTEIAAYKQSSNRTFRWLYNIVLTINSPSKVPELSPVPKLNLVSSSSVGE